MLGYQTGQRILLVLIPPPGSLGAPMFDGKNMSEFLQRFAGSCNNYQVTLHGAVKSLVESISDKSDWQAVTKCM